MLTVGLLYVCALQEPRIPPLLLVPTPQHVRAKRSPSLLPEDVRVAPVSPELTGLAEVLRDHMERVMGRPVGLASDGAAHGGDVVLRLGETGTVTANPEAYTIEVFEDHVVLTGASPAGAARLLQLLWSDEEEPLGVIPEVHIEDEPLHQ